MIKGRILFAEDENDTRKIGSELMEDRGYEIIVACDGQEALEKYDEERSAGRVIDLVVTDIIMPRMNGSTLILNLRTNRGYRGQICVETSRDPELWRKRLGEDFNVLFIGESVEKCLDAYEKSQEGAAA